MNYLLGKPLPREQLCNRFFALDAPFATAIANTTHVTWRLLGALERKMPPATHPESNPDVSGVGGVVLGSELLRVGEFQLQGLKVSHQGHCWVRRALCAPSV